MGIIRHLFTSVAIGPLADDIDAIVHELCEVLDNPHLLAAPVSSTCPTFAPDVVTREDDISGDDDAATQPHIRQLLLTHNTTTSRWTRDAAVTVLIALLAVIAFLLGLSTCVDTHRGPVNYDIADAFGPSAGHVASNGASTLAPNEGGVR